MKEIHWHLEVLSISQLKEHEKNPRQISKEKSKRLTGLIKKFGLIDKPIVNTDHTIIGGHQRIKLLKRMKAKTVECWVPDRLLEQKEIDELCIGLNLHQGTWDWDLMSCEFEVPDLLEYGFTEDEIFGHFEEKEPKEKGEKNGKKKTVCPNCSHEF